MKVRDIMTKNVAYINPNSTVVEAAQLMQKHNVGVIPVMDQNGILGMVTDRDIVVRNIAHGNNPQNTPVKDVMSSQVTTVSPDMDVNDVSAIMADKQIRRVPVMEGSRIVGIVALGDIATNPRMDVEASDALSEISKPSRPMKM